jgi:signal transduction histidine kinase/Flp pilus assembly protein TadD
MFGRTCLLLFSFFYCLQCNAQTNTINSLKKNIATAANSQEKLSAILALCSQGYTLQADTLLTYAFEAYHHAQDQKDQHAVLSAKYYMAYALTSKGRIDSALLIADQCLHTLNTTINDEVLEGRLLNQKGRCHMRKNQYKEAIDMGHKVVAKGESANDELLQVQGKTLIGWAYLEMQQTEQSLQWHLQALHTPTDTTVLKKYGILFANIALNYKALGKMDSAFYYIQRAVDYSRSGENLFALSNSLAIQAQLFVASGRSAEAEQLLKEVISIRKLIGDPFYVVSDMAQLGLYYAKNGQPEKGIAICQEGLAIATEYNIGTKLFFLYSALAENYKAAGKTKQYAEILEKIILWKDSIYTMNSEKALADIQSRHDLQKKENTIIQQKLNLTRKNYWLYSSLLVMLLAAVAIYFIFKNNRKRQQISLMLMLEKERKMSEKAVVQAEEKERKRIAADLHDNLGAYAASIASNIEQIKIFPGDKMNEIAMQALRSNSLSIVSQLNDTIWVLKKDALSLTAISDRLKIFIQRIQSSYSHLKIDVFENVEKDHLLPPAHAFHLFHVLQEAINNAIRHSGGNEINVTIESNRLSWRIVVMDDGKGMDSPFFGSEGNGLENMKSRSKEAGCDISWEPNEPSGTRFIIEPTTN